MSNQLLIHSHTHYSGNEAESELCCNVFPALLYDEIIRANIRVAQVFRELPNPFLGAQRVATGDPSQGRASMEV